MEWSISGIIEVLGTIAFALSGVFSAMQKRLDAFGVLIIGFVTATGGGTIRDVLIGYTPVSWMRDPFIPILIALTAIIAIFFKKYIKTFKLTFFLMDAVGLGLFTLIGIEKGIVAGLDKSICIILGTITGSFGGVLRDVLLNNVPQIFKKEIYATACIVGGSVYFVLISFLDQDLAQVIAVTIVVGIRIVAVKYNLSIPKI